MSIRNRATLALSGATALAVAAGLAMSATASASTNWSKVTSAAQGGGLNALVKAAKAEGKLNVIALPNNWANYGKQISTFEHKYGIKITSEAASDSSLQEIQAIKQGNGRSSAPDVVDVGQSFTSDASLFAPYKVQTWSSIPTGYKASNGTWFNDYGGYISFGCNMNVLKSTPCPTSWKALESSKYKDDVTLDGIPGQATDATAAVWDAALNNGGSFTNVQPGLKFFQTLKSDGNFNSEDCDSAQIIESGSCPIVIQWDYLNSRKAQGLPASIKWTVNDPTGTPFASYYVQAISKNAPDPAAARLWEEFLYSAQGQNIWLEGGARPVELPSLVKAGTENRAAYKALPVVKVVAKLPTNGQNVKAGTAIAAGWSS